MQRAYRGNSITEQVASKAFQNVEGFWEDLFPVERNRRNPFRNTGKKKTRHPGGMTPERRVFLF